ncbi:MAG: S8 family serine peptidase [Akkermansiaceae bacterium]|jgi:hypothetical protein
MRTSLLLLPLLLSKAQSTPIPFESVSGDKLWISPSPRSSSENLKTFRITVWFDKQLLGDSGAYQRRAKEFSKAKRTQLRNEVIAALKKESSLAFGKSASTLKELEKKGLISNIDPHWIVNGFTCSSRPKGIQQISKLPGVRKIFIRQARAIPVSKTPPMPEIPIIARPSKANPKNIPWYTTQLEADKVWQELGFAGQGTLNVIHDKNFIVSDHLQRTIYRNPKEIAGNGKDDDGNGFVDDVHGYNFDLQSNQLYTRPFTGNPKDRKILHGTNCANIVSGSGDGENRPAFGIAPLSRWAGVINLGGIEQSVEWAIEQGADTYSMSFTRTGYGEYQSHWRKVMEHGNFCGLFFVSGAGNRRDYLPEPFAMHIPQNIPNAVFAAAGVQQDLSRTPFSCIGPVIWATEHYHDGILQKPEVCAFNAKVVCQFPNGKIVPGLLNGNSYAGPMFCGAISLMLSADPDLLPWDLKEIITKTATDVGPKGMDSQTGHGLINCYKAVKEVLRRKQLRE